MQTHQKPTEQNNILSNIIEEKSEVHNISSLKPSNMPKNIKVREPTCTYCQEGNIIVDPMKPVKVQNILIYPCLCNIMMHRECLKQYLIENLSYNCPTCRANYAVGKSPNRLMAQVTSEMITQWAKNLAVFLIFIIVVVIFMIYIVSFNSTNDVVQRWRIAIDVLFGLGLGLGLIQAVCWIWSTLSKMRRNDIEVYCNQTEIGYHSIKSKLFLREFYENLPQGGSLDMSEKNERNGQDEHQVPEQHIAFEEDFEQRLSKVLQMVQENETQSPRLISPNLEPNQKLQYSNKVENHTSRHSKRTSENTERNHYRRPSFKNKSQGANPNVPTISSAIIETDDKQNRNEIMKPANTLTNGNNEEDAKEQKKHSIVIEVSDIGFDDVPPAQEIHEPKKDNNSSLEITVKDPNL